MTTVMNKELAAEAHTKEQPFRWVCSADRPIVDLPLNEVHRAGYVSCALTVATPPNVVSPLIRFMRGEEQAAALHYNRRSDALVLDNSEGDELHLALRGETHAVVTLELSAVAVLMDVGKERRLEPPDQWHSLPKAMAQSFSTIRLGSNHGIAAGWGPPVGFTFVLFEEGVLDDVQTQRPPSSGIIDTLLQIRENLDGVIGRLRA